MKRKLFILTIIFSMLITSFSMPKTVFAEDDVHTPVVYGEEQAPITKWEMNLSIGTKNYVITLTKDANGNTIVTGMDKVNEDYPNGIPKNSLFTITLEFDPSRIAFEEGDTLEYTIPEEISVTNEMSGAIYMQDGVTVITEYEVRKDGKIIFTPNTKNGPTFKNGRVSFGGKFNLEKLDDNNTSKIVIGGMELDIPIEEEVTTEVLDYTLAKRTFNPKTAEFGGINTDSKGRYIVWAFSVAASDKNTKNLTGVKVKELVPDEYKDYFKYDQNGKLVLEYYRNTVSTSNYPQDDESRLSYDEKLKTWVWDVSSVAKGKKKWMFVKIYLSDDYVSGNIKNTIVGSLEGKTDKTASGLYTEKLELNVDKSIVKTFVNEDGDLCITYRVYVKAQRNNTSSIYKAVIEDVMTGATDMIKDVVDFKYYIYTYNQKNSSKYNVYNSKYNTGYQYFLYEDYTGVNKKSEYTTYPSDMQAVYNPTTKTLRWIVDEIPTCDSYVVGGRRFEYTVVTNWNFGNNSTDSTSSMPVINNTATLSAVGKSVSASKSTEVAKKWVLKSGENVPDGTFPRKGVVKYTVDVQANYVLEGHYVLQDELGAGASYYDAGEGYPRSLMLTRKKGSTEDTTFNVYIPLKSGEPTVDENGNKTYVSAVTYDDVTYTLTLTEKADGTSNFLLDIPENSLYTYTATYYAVPDENNMIGSITNSATVGEVGDSLPVVWHLYELTNEVSHSAFIEKSTSGVNAGNGTIGWTATIKHNLSQGATITDTLDTNVATKSGYSSFYFTDEQIAAVTIKAGNETLKTNEDYTIVKNEDTRGFVITVLKDVAASDENPVVITYTSTAEGLENVEEGGNLKYPNAVSLVNNQLTARAISEATYYKNVHITKEVASYGVEDGKVNVTWRVTVNEDRDLTGEATVTDLLPAGFKYVSVTKDTEKSDEGNTATFTANAVIDRATGRDLVVINIEGLTQENGKLALLINTEVTDPAILTYAGKYTVDNTASITYNGITESDDASATLTTKQIDKQGIYREGVSEFVEYTAVINPASLDLIPTEGIGTIEVVDVYDPRTEFRRGTFKIVKADGTEIPESEHKLDVDPANHKFTFIIPDNEIVTVTYKCFATGEVNPATDVDYNAINKMSFYGYEDSTVTDETEVNVSDVNVHLETVKSFTVTKRNAVGSLLAGAKFMLYEVSVEDGKLVYTEADNATYTDASGVAKFYSFSGQYVGLDDNKIYAYKELEAPKGYYIAKEDEGYHFFAFTSKVLTDEFKEAYAAEYPEGNVDNDVILSANSYLAEVYNYKGEITVEKTFTGLSNISGNFYFGLFDSDQTTLLEVGTINFVNGKAVSKLIFRNLDFGKNAKGDLDGSAKTYYVYETDSNGNKLVANNDGQITINGVLYTVTGDGAVTISGNEQNAKQTITLNNYGQVNTELETKKNFVGGSLANTTFSFVLEGIAGTNTDGVKITASTNANGAVDFGKFNYDTEGTYKYTIREVIPTDAVDNVKNGVTYDTTVVNVEVKVEANGNGSYTVTKTFDGKTTSEFTNKYEEGGFKLIKTVTGTYADTTKKFEFTIELSDTTITGKYGDVSFTNGKATVELAHGESVTVDKLPIGITYTITETDYSADGYTVENTVQSGKITANTIDEITYQNDCNIKQISIKKIWDDAENQDGKRPQELIVLLKNGESVVKEVILSNENKWTETVQVPEKDSEGNTIKYTWVEGSLPEGYTLSDTSENGSITTLTNKYTPGKVSVTIVKVWDDAENQDGKRPEVLMVNLMNGQELVREVQLNQQNNWTATIDGLDEYTAGVKNVYTWVEGTMPEGYTLTNTSKAGTVTTLTNHYEPELTEATIVKVWDDKDNQDGKRPTSLTVQLMNGDVLVKEVVLNAANNWSETVRELDKFANGVEINYTWTEGTMPEGYTLSNTSKEGKVTTLTNSYTPGKVSATIVKVWDDKSNQDGKRPEVLMVNLMNGQELVREVQLTEQNNWTATIDGLDEYTAGVKNVYTWVEGVMPEGYTLANTSKDGTVTTLTNHYEPELTQATIVKVWDDANNQDGVRPENLIVKLMNGDTLVKEVVLNEANEWSETVSELDKFANGVEINYTWTEGTMPEGYALSNTNKEGTVTTLTNHRDVEKVEISVKKVWDDKDNQDGKRPTSIKVTLYADKEATDIIVTLDNSNKWTETIRNLPAYKEGKKIEYSWVEDTPENGYNLKSNVTDTTTNITTLTNSYTPGKVSATIVKVWDDAENQDGVRPVKLIVNLMKNGEALQQVELNKENQWTVTIEDLDEYTAGKKNVYTWVESELTDGYKLTNTETEGFVTTLTNSRTPEVIEIPVIKNWVGDSEELRPTTISVVLVKNGEDTNTIIELNKENNWSGKFENLDKYENEGKEITYTIREIRVVDYLTVIEGDQSNGFTITNTYDVTSVDVTKKWENMPEIDEDIEEPTPTQPLAVVEEPDTDEEPEVTEKTIMPESITVVLVADGVETETTLVLNEENNWSATFEHLKKYNVNDDGSYTEIVYTVKEIEVENYLTKIEGDQYEGYIITNTYNLRDIKVIKVWNEKTHKYRPKSITVNLLKDGAIYETVELNAENEWTEVFTDLPYYKVVTDEETGELVYEEIEYTIEEVEVDKYTTEITGDMEEGYVITNNLDDLWNVPDTGDRNVPVYASMISATSFVLMGIAIVLKKKYETNY